MTPTQRKVAIDTHLVNAMGACGVHFPGDPSVTFFAIINLPEPAARGRMSEILDKFQDRINGDQHLRFPPLPFDWRHQLRVIPPKVTVLDSYLYSSVGTLTYDTYRVLFPFSGF